MSIAFAGALIGVAVSAPVEAAAATPNVLSGHRFITAVPGFAPGTVVHLRLDRVIDAGTVRADRTGTVHLAVPAPLALGPHRLLVVGNIPSTRPTSSDTSSAPGDDRQAILVVVPRLVTLDFRVVPSLGVDAVDRNRDQGGDGLGTAGESATADTGVNLLLPSLVGAGLVLFGAIVTRFGRRRPTRP